MWIWMMSSAQLALKRDQMRQAETKLLEMARRFVVGEPVGTHSNYQSEVFDTTIPISSVPCLNHNEQCSSDNVAKPDLTIHAIRATNLLTNEHDESQAKNKTPAKSASSAKPLVLLHGYMNSSGYFYRNLLGLSSFFPVVYSLDLLGWGLSSRPPFSLSQDGSSDDVDSAASFFVDSLEVWRAQNNIDKMILAGHSMGGYLSVAYCEKHPERVERLILLSPVGVPDETDVTKTRRQEIHRASSWSKQLTFRAYHYLFDNHSLGEIFRALPESTGLRRMNQYVEKRIPCIDDPDERDAVASYLYFNSVLPGSGEYCLNRILNPYAFAKKPQVYRIPNLQVSHVSFLYGDNDWMDIGGGLEVQRCCAEKEARGETCPNVTVYKVRDAGHLLMLDNWQEVNAGIILSAGLTRQALESKYPIPIEESFLGSQARSTVPSGSTPPIKAHSPELSTA